MNQTTTQPSRLRKASIVAGLVLSLVLVGAAAAQPTDNANGQTTVLDYLEDFDPPISGETQGAEIVTTGEQGHALKLSTHNRTTSSYATKLVVPADVSGTKLVLPVSGRVYAADQATISVIGSNDTRLDRVIEETDSPQFQDVILDVDGFRTGEPVLIRIVLEGTSGGSNLFVEEIRLVHTTRTAGVPSPSQEDSGFLAGLSSPLVAGGFVVLLGATLWSGRRRSDEEGNPDVAKVADRIDALEHRIVGSVQDATTSSREVLNDARELLEEFRTFRHDMMLILDRVDDATDQLKDASGSRGLPVSAMDGEP